MLLICCKEKAAVSPRLMGRTWGTVWGRASAPMGRVSRELPQLRALTAAAQG